MAATAASALTKGFSILGRCGSQLRGTQWMYRELAFSPLDVRFLMPLISSEPTAPWPLGIQGIPYRSVHPSLRKSESTLDQRGRFGSEVERGSERRATQTFWCVARAQPRAPL